MKPTEHGYARCNVCGVWMRPEHLTAGSCTDGERCKRLFQSAGPEHAAALAADRVREALEKRAEAEKKSTSST